MTADSAFVYDAQQAQQLEMFVRLSRHLAMPLQSDELYRTFLSSVRHLVPCDCMLLYLSSQGTQDLVPVAELTCAVDAPIEEQEVYAMAVKTEVQRAKVDVRDTGSLAAWAALHRHPMLRGPVQHTKDGSAATSEHAAGLAAPLISKGTLYGVLLLKRHAAFTSAELRLARTLSEIAALALGNAALFQALHTEQERAQAVKANFVSMVTHELRSPLNTINGYLDLALTGVGGELNEQVREFLRRARTGSENLYTLLENLLLLARADAGLWKLNRQRLDLQDIVADAVEALELTASDAGIEMIVEDVEHVPSLYADEVRLQQLVRNLLSNALRFTPAGGSVILAASVEPNTFEGNAPQQPQALALRVGDTGYGIAPEFQQRIFERFYQVPNTPVGRKGQGLGLTIVKMIAELHGGRVMVESEPGRGSTFTCILPCLLTAQSDVGA